MAEFCEVMRQWHRICCEFTRLGMENGYGCIASGCPMGHSHVCGGDIKEADDADYAKAETDIMKWAAEHPEPVYPTWEQAIAILYLRSGRTKYSSILEWERNESIPADIAQKLGIELKEG